MGDLYSALSHKSREITLSYWQDRVKPGFTGKLDNEFGDVDCFVPIPGVSDDPTIPIKDGFLQLSRYGIYLGYLFHIAEAGANWLTATILKTSLSLSLRSLRS